MPFTDEILDIADRNDDLLPDSALNWGVKIHSLTRADWLNSDEAALFGFRSPDGFLAWLGY